MKSWRGSWRSAARRRRSWSSAWGSCASSWSRGAPIWPGCAARSRRRPPTRSAAPRTCGRAPRSGGASERAAAECEAALLQTRSRLESLEQIQETYEGFTRGVRSIMQAGARGDGVLGVVADVIGIPQEYERAVAAVLGERLQYVIVRGEEDGAGAVDRLRAQASGRGSFIPLNPRTYEHGAETLNGTSKRMLDLVKFDDSFRPVAEALLGDAVLVPDLQAAVAVWKKNGVRVTLVTPEGDVMHPSGVITGGSDHPVEEEILARRREIEALRASAAIDAARLAEVQARLHGVASGIDEAESALRAAGEHVHALTVQIVAAEKDIERLEQAIPEANSRRDVVRFEIQSLVEEDGQLREAGDDLHQRLAGAENRQRELAAKAAEAQRQREAVAVDAETLRAEVTAVQVRVAERRQRQQAGEQALLELQARQSELAERLAHRGEELAAAVRERDQLDADIEAARRREGEQENRRRELQDELGRGAAAVAERRREVERQDRQVHDGQQRLDRARSAAQEVELARSERRLRLEHLAEGVRERYACDIPALEESECASEEIARDEAARLEGLKERLVRLGDVNPAAIEELRELEERGSFLAAQKDDLERSLSDLERTIQKLNRASRARFAETFARANETFQKVFPRLFRGGEGEAGADRRAQLARDRRGHRRAAAGQASRHRQLCSRAARRHWSR